MPGGPWADETPRRAKRALVADAPHDVRPQARDATEFGLPDWHA